jgi:SAM-dependent methyltransferase
MGRVRSVATTCSEHLALRGVTHVTCCQSDAEHLPFATSSFDAIVCRIAAHHFPLVSAFVTESARVLKIGATLALADNMTSGEAKIAQFFNTFEKLRDPSHHWAYSLEDWQTFFFTAGLTVTHCEVFEKELDFDDWASRAGVAGDDLTRLRALLLQCPDRVGEWLKPRQIGSRLLFTLTEGIVIGHKPTH